MLKLFRLKCAKRRHINRDDMYPFVHFKMFSISCLCNSCCKGGRCHFVVECFDDINVFENVIVRNTRNDNNVFDLGKMENKGFIELKVILRFLVK